MQFIPNLLHNTRQAPGPLPPLSWSYSCLLRIHHCMYCGVHIYWNMWNTQIAFKNMHIYEHVCLTHISLILYKSKLMIHVEILEVSYIHLKFMRVKKLLKFSLISWELVRGQIAFGDFLARCAKDFFSGDPCWESLCNQRAIWLTWDSGKSHAVLIVRKSE